jgi:hypothetical protein
MSYTEYPFQGCDPGRTRRLKYVLLDALDTKADLMPRRKCGCVLHFVEYLRDLDEPDGAIRSSVRQISFEFIYNMD